VAVAQVSGARSLVGVLDVTAGLTRKAAQKQRRRVTFTRIVPSARNFIRDADNLMFSVKPALDSLKRLGLIYDDSMKWLEQPIPTQEVGKDWATVIQIEVLGG
jgi:hypothetical protein